MKTPLILVFAALALASWPSGSIAYELLLDGGFDSGAPWEIPAGQTAWSLDTVGTSTPVSRAPTSARGGGSGLYAISDQRTPSTNVMYQPFVVPDNARGLVLSFDMFVNDWSSQPVFHSSQHARVDIIRGNVSVYDTGSGVVVNVFTGTDGGPLPNDFRHYEFNLSPFLQPGGSYLVRFYEIDNLNVLNMGVDNVSLLYVPEPSTAALAGIAAAALIFALLRRLSICGR